MSQATTSAVNTAAVDFALTAKLSMSAFGEDPSRECPAFPADHAHKDFVQEANPAYKFRTSIRMPVMNWLFAPGGDALALTGPTGSGKTSLIREIAARLNWPYLQANAHSRMEVPDLIGSMALECDPVTGDQRTVFRHGPLALAMKHGFVFCLDEGDFLDPSVMSGLNAILEGSPLVIPENGGEIIRPHKFFRFVITCNTRGQGDETGLYGGTVSQNLATWDRYRMVEVPYMEEADEVDTLVQIMGTAATEVVKTMVKVANAVRKQFVGNPDSQGSGSLTVTFSTRTLLRWARIGTTYSRNRVGSAAFAMALREALTNRAPVDQRIVVHTIARDLFGAEAWGDDDVLKAQGI